ncbi:HAD family hydrolase [Pseudarthrobacter sp. J64]|uniref:HAD family hydrolase n=1 Tax=unclassified Pseudarthrobacter TaxID=2647000 RepID=UPI002E8065F7|nr:MULTISPECIES: HAD family hydrolase [unclassified Pseudarthrobacter]MEE2524509.1 HAD family hydrolase [Pseudarthrobacter sp. J47]MEE2570771.1 HAD family hydrolase [Pseudarthrobacter sp. J64]
MSAEPGGALLWDLDGTLIDSEERWALVCREVAEASGVGEWRPSPADISGLAIPILAGMLWERGAAGTLRSLTMALTERMRTVNRRDGVRWRPGALDLLEAAHRNGVRQALVTMSLEMNVIDILEQLPRPYFAEIVTAGMVARHKPAPDPYLLALNRLDLPASGSVAIEDSPAGLRSACDAGLNVIAVPCSGAIKPSDGYRIWDSLAARGLPDLVAAGLAVARLGLEN